MFKNATGQRVDIYAFDGSTGKGKAGDAANITARISKDGGTSAAVADTNPTERDAVNMPGLYSFDVTQAETNADLLILHPLSSTSLIRIDPVSMYTLAFPTPPAIPNPPQDATGPLQKTIFDALKADAVLADAPLSGRIFGDVPDNLVFPYIRIGEFETQPWRTMTRPGEEVLITVHIFSDERGNKEAQGIRDRVNRVLGDNIDLTVVGFALNFITRIGGRTITEESTGGRKIRHIIDTYRAKLQQDLP